MKTFTAKEAKTHFGEFLDAMQREPVIVTKNGRNVGMMVSLDDPHSALIQEWYQPKQEGYDEWVDARLKERLAAYKAGEPTYSHQEAMDYVRQRVKELAAERLAQKKAA
ncbi:MAG: type II toxin-antitoxin system Phd/YefM family antitoxin [Brachymonas sp.]|nr:type II toxin-antitoxin system Phd/YefM family antitoxin [Brachymonas sp.]